MCRAHNIEQDDRRALSIPLFAARGGTSVVKKEAVVASWRALFRAALEPSEQQLAGAITGPSARRSGAKTLCRCGWQLWQVRFHARWASDAVKGYTEEVFAEVADTWSLVGQQASPPRALTCAPSSVVELADILDHIEDVGEPRAADGRGHRRGGGEDRQQPCRHIRNHPQGSG